MDKLESLRIFINKEVEPISKKYLDVVVHSYFKEKNNLINNFLEEFYSFVDTIKGLEQADSIHFCYSFLYTHLLVKKPVYLIEAIREQQSLGETLSASGYHPEWLFQPLYSFYDEILEKYKSYRVYINTIDLEKLFLLESKLYQQIFVKITTESLTQLVRHEKFSQMEYDFTLCIKEYNGKTRIIAKKNKDILHKMGGIDGLLSNSAGIQNK